jgi:cation transporter-like permease
LFISPLHTENYKEGDDKVRKRLLVALLSSVLFSLVFSLFSYTPESQRSPDTYYFGIWETFFFTVIYVTPIYLIIGMPISFVIDKWFKKKWETKSYLLKVAIYSIVSLIPALIVFNVFNFGISPFSLQSFLKTILLSAIASNLFFHIQLLVNRLIKEIA